MELEVRDLKVDIHRKVIVKGVNLHVNDGEFVGLMGPNGSGKSTLLKALYRLIKPTSGHVLWEGIDSSSISQHDFARMVAVVSQFNDLAFDFSVEEVVMMGRSPHLSALASESDEDYSLVDDALRMVDLASFKNRSFSSLSGGERQRVVLARALAQQPQFLILDEPTNHLDIKHQLTTLAIVRNLGVSCLAALHDLAMTSRFVDRLYLMKEGAFIADGIPEEVIVSPVIKNAYDVDAKVTKDGEGGLSIDYRCPHLR